MQQFLSKNVDMILINAFIMVWCVMTLIYITPPGPLATIEHNAIHPFFDCFCIRQYWGVFAPSFRDFNEHGQFFIDYTDGTVGMREPLRLDRIDDLFERERRGKLREYLVDNLLTTDHELAFSGVARFVGRAVNVPDNPPRYVTMGANWARILQDPYVPVKDLPQDCFHYSMFSHRIEPDDLK